jgi:Protein of unknown function (DUF3052)
MAAAKPAGYSGTPLASKLGIKAGAGLFLVGAPDHYRKLLSPLPEGVRFLKTFSSAADIAHVFVTRKTDLTKSLRDILPLLRPEGVIWVSWPKKSSKVPSDVTEDTIRELALPLGLVDIKVCAVDEVWSGLKLVIRKALRGNSK